MVTRECDTFESVYRLIRRGRFQGALRRLLDNKGLLAVEFRCDVNHGYYIAGDIFFKKREYLRAKDAFRRALKAWPCDLEALQALGNCYDKLNRPRMAERAFQRAVDYIDKGALKCRGRLNLALRLNLANSLFDQKKYVEAENIYRLLVGARGGIGLAARRNLMASQSKRLANKAK